MSKSNLIAALDMGSKKITAVAAEVDTETNSIKIVAGKEVVCKGLDGGVVVDMAETSAAVIETINFFEQETDKSIEALYIAIRGSDICTINNTGTYNKTDSNTEITSKDIDQVLANAQSIQINGDIEIVAVEPQVFYVDDKKVKNPEGMDAKNIKGIVALTTRLRTLSNNLTKAIVRSGYRLDGKFYGLMCLGESVLTEEEKKQGVILIDMGGDTTSVGVFIDGFLQCSRDINKGADLITQDIAKVFRTSYASAEEVKKKYGFTYVDPMDDNEVVPVPTIDGRETRDMAKSELLDTIQPCVNEILKEVKDFVDEIKETCYIPNCVITGGGSNLKGMESQCAKFLGFEEIRKAILQPDLLECEDCFLTPAYSTALSLALYAVKRELLGETLRDNKKNKSNVSIVSKILDTIKNLGFYGG